VLIARRKLIVSAPRSSPSTIRSGRRRKRSLQQIGGGNLGLAQLALDGDQADAVGTGQAQFGGVFHQHHPFMRGISRSMALRKVVLPVEVPPEIRIVRRRCTDRFAQKGDRLGHRIGLGASAAAAIGPRS
jgi:hypothetical protein